jgi:phage terminase large subunit
LSRLFVGPPVPQPILTIPHNGWKPRSYQRDVWDYLKPTKDKDGKIIPSESARHAELIWHRRAGKDEICMHNAACAMVERPATYWHMLPKANQVRKAIWQAVNPTSGIRRIDEAFPDQLFSKNETEMMVKCRYNPSTWQCLGSDNYEGAIGSPPLGITWSEWAQANPSARGYLRPIIAENKGWQVFITTPRGKNHAYQTFESAKKNPNAFAQLLTVHDTGMLNPQELLVELQEYVDTYGEDMGLALYEQEYECSFTAAIMGAYYGAEFARIDREGRICHCPYEAPWPVHVAMDIGYDDDTAIYWFQIVGGEPRIIGSYANSGKDPDHYCSVLLGKEVSINFVHDKLEVEFGADNAYARHQEFQYASINLPHDAMAKTFAAKGKSVEEQFAAVFGWGAIKRVPRLSVQDGIQAVRKLLNRVVIDDNADMEAVRQYHREWNDDKKMFDDKPEHDWTSHYADCLRYLAIVWSEDKLPKEAIPPKWAQDRTFNDVIAQRKRKRRV